MTRNEGSVNLKSLSTPESLKTILSSTELHIASSETHHRFKKSWYSFAGPISGSAWLRLLHSLPSHM